MSVSSELYTVVNPGTSTGFTKHASVPLVIAMYGYADAGQAVDQVAHTLTRRMDAELYATFSGDEFVDYRSRRPSVTVSYGTVSNSGYQDIELWLVRDENTRPFFVLTGPEPDYKWQTFIQALHQLLAPFSVDISISVNGYETNSPHTRPVLVSAITNTEPLLEHFRVTPNEFTIHSSLAMQVNLDFDRLGLSFISLTAQVPHYVSGWAYPAAAQALLRGIETVTGLSIPTHYLDTSVARMTADLAEYAEEAPQDFLETLAEMEEHYDSLIARSGINNGSPRLLAPGQSIPTPEELGDEIEQFLANDQWGKPNLGFNTSVDPE